MDDYQWEKKKHELEKIAAMVQNMSDEQRLDFKIALARRMSLLATKFETNSEKYEKLYNIPTKRVLGSRQSNIYIVSHLLAGIAAGIGVDVAMFGGLDINAILWTLSGASLGFVAAIINGTAYEAKPIENAFNKFRTYMTEKRIDRIEDKWQTDNYLNGLIEEFEMGK